MKICVVGDIYMHLNALFASSHYFVFASVRSDDPIRRNKRFL